MGILAVAVLFGVYKKYEEQIRFLGVETETIMLIPPDEMKQIDYKDSVEIIKNRVKKLSQDHKYWVEDDDGKIRVVIPYGLYKETGNKLETYLTKPLKLRIGTIANDNGTWVRQEGDIEIPQKEIQSIKEIELSEEEKDAQENGSAKELKKVEVILQLFPVKA